MPRILIADDNTNIQKMVALAFQESGIDVVSVGNGEAAVRRLGELNPDLVLADIFMPVRNGYEVCEYVKKDQRFAQVPVILLVGAFDPLDEKEARRVGADGILKKPFVPPDPLIAMVTSVLEKNPKVAAELAKAKAAKEVVPEPVAPAVPEPEVLLKREVKPLPEFPEPTAEEAALVYGFGSGRRTLGDDVESPAAEPPAPVGAAKDEADEEESHISTAHDWRRAAADFEVPEDMAQQAALPSDEAFGTALHAEQEKPAPTPARRFDFHAAIEAVEAAEEHHKLDSTASSAPLSAPLSEKEQQVFGSAAVSEDSHASQDHAFLDAPVPEVMTLEEHVVVAEPSPVHEVPASPSSIAQPESLPSPSLPAPSSAPEQPQAAASQPQETAAGSGVRHWMDALAGGPSSLLGGWMDSLKRKREPAAEAQASSAPSAAVPQAEAHEHQSSRGEALSELAHEEIVHAQVVESQPAASVVPEAEAAATEQREEPAFAVPSVASASNEVSDDEVSDDQDRAQVESWPAEPLNFDAASAPHFEVNAGRASDLIDEEPAVHVAPGPLLDSQDSGEDAKVLRDPGLIEPEAVHVRPEPILEDDEALAAPSVEVRKEEVAPAYSFFRDASAPSTAESHADERSEPEPSGDRDETPTFAESAAHDFGERIPTGPPPNREALADIPFLTPPPDFHAQQRPEMDAETVDAIVQRVVEKLGPQLQELLSQNMKPLVENLIQNELTKKD